MDLRGYSLASAPIWYLREVLNKQTLNERDRERIGSEIRSRLQERGEFRRKSSRNSSPDPQKGNDNA